MNVKEHPYLVVSGLPGSGKTTLGRQLAAGLRLPLFDKDDILEALFDALGVGDADWRQRLSRASDVILQRLALASNGAVLTSFWRNSQITTPSGTPTDWLAGASKPIVEVYCRCEPEVAAARYLSRVRHPGHLDSAKRAEDVLCQFRALAAMGPLGVGKLLTIETTDDIDAGRVITDIEALLGNL
jgi:thymidylate kinase